MDSSLSPTSSSSPTASSSSSSEEESSSSLSLLMDIDDGVLLLTSLEYLDTVSLIKKKPVCKQWQHLCTNAIDNKCQEGYKKKKKVFESKSELETAVNQYCGSYNPGINNYGWEWCSPNDFEDIASTYGYPIDKWDVTNIKDFSGLFVHKSRFNEPIGSWNVSNATNMNEMFWGARGFNQDLSKWNVSKVTKMFGMFYDATSFNQDISSWDVSKVTDMSGTFYCALSFNQDITCWDVSNVTGFYLMFTGSAVDSGSLPWFPAED